MIKVKPSIIKGVKSASGTPTKVELLQATFQHIADVQCAIAWICGKLIEAGAAHDHTKISGIDDFHETYAQSLTKDAFYSSEWYKAHLQERHHLSARCPDDVTLIDVLERIADIVTAGISRNGTVYEDNLDPEILIKAYKNTVDLLIRQIE